MKSSIFAAASLALVAALVPFTAAQRITGDSGCVNSCYQISVAVTQCPDLTDSGVISCICPNSSQVAQLDSCHGCISSLSGVSELETNSINTLFNACSSNSTAASGSANPSSAAGSGTIGSGSNSAAQTSTTPTGAGFETAHAAGLLTVAVAAVAAFVTF